MTDGVNVHLVDGTYELFRSYYGAPSSLAPDGREVGAVRGLLASLGGLLRDEHTSHVGVAFDTVVESFRNQLFDGYKTGEGIDEDLWAQFPLAERAVRALGCVVWPMIEFEADDGLAVGGGALRRRTSASSRVYICTPDKDLGTDGRRARSCSYDRKQQQALRRGRGLREVRGSRRESIPDYLALVGDAQDGIPGAAQVGRQVDGDGAVSATAISRQIPDGRRGLGR